MFQYRLYPTRKQETKLNETLEECRWLYNYLLEKRKNAWEQRGESLTCYGQINTFPILKQERVRSGLSDLDIELVRLAAQGCSNKEIAARQFWSEVTVKRKMQDIYRKLQVTDRVQAVAEAMRMGLI